MFRTEHRKVLFIQCTFYNKSENHYSQGGQVMPMSCPRTVSKSGQTSDNGQHRWLTHNWIATNI